MPIFLIAEHDRGLPEYEGREFLVDPREVEAPDLDAAKRLYADITGLSRQEHWNPETLTVWIFPLVDVATMGDGWKQLDPRLHGNKRETLVRRCGIVR